AAWFAIRGVHRVRDAVSVADALHITVFSHLFQTPHYGYARQLQRVRDLTCANRRAHDGPQEDVDADSSISQAITVGRELCAVVVGNGSQQTQVQAGDEQPLAC